MKMKKIFGFVVILLVVVSCNDVTFHVQGVKKNNENSVEDIKIRENVNGRPKPSNKTYIQLEDGEYTSVCDYVPLTLGVTFPHPTIVDQSGVTDGEPIIGYDFIDSRDWPGSLNKIVGARFSMILPTGDFDPVTIDEIRSYHNALQIYWLALEVSDDQSGLIRPVLNTSNQGFTPIEVTGIVVRDHESPTNASVIWDDNYVYESPALPNPGNGIFLGTLQKNGFSIKFYANADEPGEISIGTVSSVEVRNTSNTIVSAIPLSIKYTLNYDLDKYHMKGTLKIGTTFLPIDDDILTAW